MERKGSIPNTADRPVSLLPFRPVWIFLLSMSTQRMIKDSFWTDSYIAELDPSEKLLFIYLLTNPLCNIAGIYEIQLRRIAFDTGFDVDMVNKILSRFAKDGKILRSDEWILIVNHAKHQSYKNPNVTEGIRRIIELLPDKVKALKGFERLSHLTLLNLTLPNASSEGTKKKMYTYTPIDENGNPTRKKKTDPKGVKERNAEYISVGFMFEKMAEKSTGVKPDLSKAYFVIKNAREKLGVKDFKDLFTYFFADQKLKPEQHVSLAFVCSPSYVKQWEANRKNKKASQVEAASEIRL